MTKRGKVLSLALHHLKQMDYSTQLMQAMLEHGYKIHITPYPCGNVFIVINGPCLKSEKLVKDYSTAVGLAAYWISETNGVPNDAKQAVNAILYRKVKKGHRTEAASHQHPRYQNTVTLAFAYELEDKLDTALDLLKQANAVIPSKDIKTFLDSEP